jgi:3-oxoacyl-(acyl-carrier-protein) synthase
LSEGAGAILLSREGAIKIDTIDAGGNFSRQRDAARILEGILYRLKQDASDQCIICSANGTFVDLAEVEAIAREMPAAIVYSFKSALGESVGASALWQTIAAAEALRTKRLPKMPESYTVHALRFPSRGEISFNNAIVLSCGLNHQAAGLRLSI